ncbi:MAG: hypothetical protein ABIO70_23755 [Pseudomonadota bacterium]
MAPLLLLLGLPLATAAPVAGGTQLALYPAGVDMLAGWFEGEHYQLEEPQVGGDYSCWDELGIREFNLEIPVETVTASLCQGSLDVRITFDTIHGEDMEVYGLDEDYFDLCPEFESELWYLTVTDPAVEISLLPRVRDGALEVEVLGTPTVTGDLDMDIDWWPDDLVLAFYEETIFEELADYARELVPELVAETLGEQALGGSYEDYAVSAELSDAEVTTGAIALGAEFSVDWLGTSTCGPEEEQAPAGREPDLDLSTSRGSTLSVGLTEWQINALVRQLQADGYFCFDPDRMDLVYQAVEELFDPSAADLQASAVLVEAPVITVDPGGADALLQGISLEVTGVIDGQRVPLLAVEADLWALLELGVDPTLAALTLQLHLLDLRISSLEAEHLLSDSQEAESHLIDFLEGWVAEWVEEQVQGVPLFAAQYHLYGTYLKLDSVDWVSGGVILRASLYDEDDPAVDLTPPDTEAWLEGMNSLWGSATFGWRGTDDRATDLAVASNLDGTGWSTWFTEDQIGVKCSPGPHRVEIKTRDNWLNEDPTPAVVEFDLPPRGDDTLEGGVCGCAAGGRLRGAWALLLGLLFLRARRPM